MLKPMVVVGLIALWSYSLQNGCNDLQKSLTHLSYYPIRDMRQTVVIDPQRTVFRNPDSLSVPTIGRDPYTFDTAPYEVAGAKIQNPISGEESVVRGDSLFHRICTPCHGKSMAGDGLVVANYIPPPDLLAEGTRSRTDGYMYMYMRHGGAVMPSYGNALSSRDGWDLVNYIRHMQKVSPR